MRSANSLLLLAAATAVVISAAPVDDPSSTPLLDKLVKHPEEYVVPGEYLVTVKPDTDLDWHVSAVSNLFEDKASQGEVLKTFHMGNFKGYHIRSHDDHVLQSIAAIDEVVRIEPNTYMSGAMCSSHDTINWGLTRINFDRVPDYSTERRYHYDTRGDGVNIYVLDSGIKKSIDAFDGAGVYYGYDFVDTRTRANGQNTDEHGHGTGIAAALVSGCCGIAKGATIIDVRVLNENNQGSQAVTLSGLEWVVNTQRSTPTADIWWTNQPALINLSVQGHVFSQTLDDALRAVYLAGITTVVASGNKRRKACEVTPGGSHYVISVAATDRMDRFWYPSAGDGSNYGKCVDILAPGVAIQVPSLRLSVFRSATGTSIAAAFVSGTLARLASSGTPPSPPALKSALLRRASTPTISNLQPKTTNKFVHMECV